MSKKYHVSATINGDECEFLCEPQQTLLDILRDELMLSTARNRYLLAHIEKTLRSVAAAQKAAASRGDFRSAWTNIRFGGEPSKSARRQVLPHRWPG